MDSDTVWAHQLSMPFPLAKQAVGTELSPVSLLGRPRCLSRLEFPCILRPLLIYPRQVVTHLSAALKQGSEMCAPGRA